MASIHVRISEVFPTHEPTHLWPLPGGELGKRARHWLPSSGEVGGGFMVATHFQKMEVFALQEPRSNRREEALIDFGFRISDLE
ncbi:MAG: hypothetical protein DME22_16340 [Verrucomicrobia bacterium]|nr:MAG: hypothetical protein DME22_16340 [Verrucomicrobiota bacterium]PYJ99535.1 MAG: hypothetical protein DME23_09350 [Verrucomicrobiota bacterium]